MDGGFPQPLAFSEGPNFFKENDVDAVVKIESFSQPIFERKISHLGAKADLGFSRVEGADFQKI